MNLLPSQQGQSARKLAGIVDRLLGWVQISCWLTGRLTGCSSWPKVTGATILSTGASVDTDLGPSQGRQGFLVWLLSRPEHPVKGIASWQGKL